MALPYTPATKTLKAIDQALVKDGGAAYRKWLKQILPKIEDAYRGEEKPFRGHLGISQVGRTCAREIFYGFWWASKNKIGDDEETQARFIRLFNRGHLEEGRFLAVLHLVEGMTLYYETKDGGQYRVTDFGGHYGSALDGIIIGCPDIPKGAPAYGEFKTHNYKNFEKLIDKKKGGIRNTKPEHYVQMQQCMGYYDFDYGFYFATCKNDDRFHAEIITRDKDNFNTYRNRAYHIIFSNKKNPPPKIADSVSWFECRYCSKKEICHGTEVPEINCRTCLHSSPLENGNWHCALGQPEINTQASFKGCQYHVFNPHLLNTTFNGTSPDGCHIDITLVSGERILSGPNQITSEELKAKGLK